MSDKESQMLNTSQSQERAIDAGCDDLQEDVEHQQVPVSKVFTSGERDEYVMIGRTKVLRSELWNAFGGDLQPGIHAPPPRRFANPAPLGLCGFALTTFVLSMSNARAMGITVANVAVGPAFFYGGIIQLLSGMWEISLDNTFGGTVLSSYGGFWLSWAAIQIDWFGIQRAYDDPIMLNNGLGFFLLGWVIFTLMVLICTVKSTVAFFSLFFFLEMTFLLLTIGEFTRSVGVTRAAGVFGVITSFLGWYNALAGFATRENSYFVATAVPLPGAKRAQVHS
ncbi:acetate uptake transporter family protein CYBJADRAFT_128088 [Cyberlindnera jadinii NRRL Y-1542]|uniref:FUN34 protein n=1 Tax=Cyberlindnera jadinii (strain ATCC 18201 / CBS 1600 / BCRC 20928 / JCM 3617 / NBRC 0987 / NRRL Y-1542) TaxID=983966 RepID=A0A1E4S1M3_CYBJN|nr:hypothetical protein CYBJADRAFT_128088 [Cyberlindnera jadinii NRRL Y-1542]ODV73406.1 hypothetical protein CYBJADRAFT_128088 [Cyberlindnera jadinii NRRL Y-1542]